MPLCWLPCCTVLSHGLYINWQTVSVHDETSIMGNFWRDKIHPNTILIQMNVLWLGYMRRMGHERLPRQILYSQVHEGMLNRERLRLRFKDTVKRNTKKMNIDKSTWQEKAKKVETAGGVTSNLSEDSHCRTDRLQMMKMIVHSKNKLIFFSQQSRVLRAIELYIRCKYVYSFYGLSYFIHLMSLVFHMLTLLVSSYPPGHSIIFPSVKIVQEGIDFSQTVMYNSLLSGNMLVYDI